MVGRSTIWTRVSVSMLPAPIQSALEGKRIFITGGTGTFGKWLIHELKNIACKLVLLTRDAPLFLKSFPEFDVEKITFIEGDVRDFNYPKGYFDYIIHAATPVVSDSLCDDDLMAIIVAGTTRVIDFAAHVGCKRMLYVSSGAVYGKQPPELEQIPESFPCNPISAYGKGKLIAENLCLSSGVNCVIARCFAFVGPSMPLNAHLAIGNFIGSCLKNESIEIEGDGTPLRSYMYASDLAEWLMVVLLMGNEGEVYNVGSDVAISILDLALEVRHVLSTKNLINVRNAVSSGQVIERYVPSNRKAIESLGLQMKFDLACSIRSTAQSYAALNS